MSIDRIPPLITRPHIFSAAFFALFLFLLYLAAGLLAPFLSALLWAAVLVLALHPVYRKMLFLLGDRPGAASAVMIMVTALFVIVPMLLLLAMLASQTVDFYQWTAEGIRSGAAAGALNRLIESVSRVLAHPLLEGLDVKAMAVKGVSQASLVLAEQLGAALKNAVLLAVNIVIMLITLFFFFRDGERYYRSALDLLPFPRERKQVITRKLHETFTAVVNGVMLIAALQGLMTGIGFALFRIPFPVLWGFLAAVLALLPVGGAAIVWVPGVLYLLLADATLRGVLLAVWGVLLITLPDNILKPLLIGKKADLPTFFLFLSILGGLRAYGILGIFAGPLIVTLVTAFIRIYREEYGDAGSRLQ